MDYHLQKAAPAHFADIAAIWHDGWHEAHADLVPTSLTRLRTQDSFLPRVAEFADTTCVALMGEEVAGFCMTKADELYQMYVTDWARGTGMARALIEDAEARIHAAGHRTAWLACAIGNQRAMRFYEKSGWHNTGAATVQLDTAQGSFPLEVFRYEKTLA